MRLRAKNRICPPWTLNRKSGNYQKEAVVKCYGNSEEKGDFHLEEGDMDGTTGRMAGSKVLAKIKAMQEGPIWLERNCIRESNKLKGLVII